MKRSQALYGLISSLILASSLTACGGRAPGMGVDQPLMDQPVADQPSYQQPVDNTPISQPPSYTDPSGGYPGTAPITTPVINQPMNVSPVGEYKVDQSLLSDWQARGIAVSGGSIYIAATDSSGLSRKGTVLKMNATTGKDVKDLGSTLLGLRHPLDSTIQGVAMAGGNLYAIDSSKGLFSIRTSGGEIKELKGTGGMDIAGSNSGLFIAAGGFLERSDMSGAARAPMQGIPASAGIGSDSRGGVYFVAGNRVGVIDPMNGMPRDVVSQGLMTPVDVAGDGRTGEIYVLEQTQVKRFSQAGQLMGSFAHNAAQPSSIAIDESGNVYIADFGSSSGTSKIVKFAAIGGTIGIPGNGMNYGSGYGAGYGSGYGTTPGYGSGYGAGYNSGYGATPGYGSGYGTGYSQGYGAYNVPNQMPQQQAPVMQPAQQRQPNRQY